ncbi:MAG: NYN domain-containing protein [Acidimicrobiia bacterium]
MPNRVTFLIDGFNVYHSIREGQDIDGRVLVWLDMKSLCESCLDILGRDAVLAEVWYFSAYAEHLTPSKPDVVRRHRTYVAALRNSGVQVEMGRFKDKDVWCPSCKTDFVRHEEKETDVAIAAKLFEVLHTDACDTAVLVSGDTDLLPAIGTGQRLFPDKQIVVAFPDKRTNAQLRQAVPFSFKIRRHRYANNQFPEEIELPSGQRLVKPAGW